MAVSAALQDRLFMLGIGLTACAVIDVMRRMLIHYRSSAIEAPAENKPQYVTQEVEDSLKISTLRKLLDSPNFAIQETAAIIVCERALHDATTVDVLLWHITQPQYKLREQGIRALNMMVNSSTIAHLNSPSTYAALVKSLTFSLTDYPHTPFSSTWDNWNLRDCVEQGCLLLLTQLTSKFGPNRLVAAHFVTRWLVHEPWGADPLERQTNFLAGLTNPSFRIHELAQPIFDHRLGREQLRAAGLVPENMMAVPSRLDRDRDIRMQGGEGTAGEGDEELEGMYVDSSLRRVGQSEEEEHVRRRHREAMVLNDGTRPLERGDIFQREREEENSRLVDWDEDDSGYM